MAWDEPGAGRSADVPADFRLAGYARCLAAVIEALGVGPAHVAGLSWGGTVPLERSYPDLVARLILADSYAGWKGSLAPDEVQARGAAMRGTLIASPTAIGMTPGLFAGDPPAAFVSLPAEIGTGVRADTLLQQLSIMADGDERDLLPQIQAPTPLIWGELDARSPLRVAHHSSGRSPTPVSSCFRAVVT